MTEKNLAVLLIILFFTSCSINGDKKENHFEVKHSGAMRNVMMKGDLQSNIEMDTLIGRNGLYGIGPLEKLRGEILINDGDVFVSTITSENSIKVEQSVNVSAPFFVYSTVDDWKKIDLPGSVASIDDLEALLIKKYSIYQVPFPFKLDGKVSYASIHVQNLPPGTLIRSPEDVHPHRSDFVIENTQVEIIGFFSKNHQGIYTHHDSFIHMHLITTDRNLMGHLDEAVFLDMTLYLPVN
jgi:acetolactate decarboxylase